MRNKPAHDRIENEKPVRPDLVLCEETDDQRFLIWLLKGKNFLGDDKFPHFQIMTTGGKDRLTEKLNTLARQEGFDSPQNKVKSITVIFDADDDAKKAGDRIGRAFKAAGFPVPEGPGIKAQSQKVAYPDVATGFMLFPKLDKQPQKGALETLCLDIFSQKDKVYNCVQTAMSESGINYANPLKNRLHAALSLTNEYVGKTIGQAAMAGAFNNNPKNFDGLAEFLKQMAGN